MSKLVKLEGARLPLAPEWLTGIHSQEDGEVEVNVSDDCLVVRAAERRANTHSRGKVAAHLKLAGGSLSHLVTGMTEDKTEWDWTGADMD